MRTAKFIEALHEGVVPATGCTEPIAVARNYLESDTIEEIDVKVSLNIMKNAMAVIVPGTGEPGLEVAAATGALIGNSDAGLKVISDIQASDLPKIKELAHSGKVQIQLADVADDLYVDVRLIGRRHEAERGSH